MLDVASGAASAAAGTMLAHEVVLRYGKSTVVDGASIRLSPGEVTALIGPNGSGKSTLLRSMARLHERAAGVITLSNSHGEAREISTLNGRTFAHEVTLFAQSHATPEGLAVADIVAFGRHPYRRGFSGLSDADHAAIASAMELTGTTSMSRKAAGELSGGELQRVWLAVCLAQQTNVVLLDEPTNHLDLRYQVETLDLVHDLARQDRLAIGIVLHDLNQAAALADRLVLMKHGRVYVSGTPAEVLTADNLSEVYEIPVQVLSDKQNGLLRIEPVSRHRMS
ncbi:MULTISPECIES: ABC transporter ATP-binding protein [Micrococcaceae]|uniref:ABC transporter ATP-binding protein n=2 Tax=Micrococcales TaxID=85006 RepID=UPI000CFDE21A|nr:MULTISPECIES: ABC transporter ATP-binding protein [unclassified Arthrobacter]PQZ86795.1 iron ABC transporter [Arthrobacter sp. MYb222]PRB73560.1 iron ABC transporter [Arthrobacter sp. MYb214]